MQKRFIWIIFLLFFVDAVCPVAKRGLKWDHMNCWMISALSALINTKPLRDALPKNPSEIKILSTDSEDISKKKKILQEFIKIMNHSFESSPTPVPTEDFYKEIYHPTYENIIKDENGKEIGKETMGNYGFKWAKFYQATAFLEHFLGDINIAYPKLQDMFFSPPKDSVDAYECYDADTIRHIFYKNNVTSNVIYPTLFSGLGIDNKDMGFCPNPFDLIKWAFAKGLLNTGKCDVIYNLPAICQEAKCSTYDSYKQIRFTAFKKAPRIMIFENSMQAGGFADCYGVKIPLDFKIPREFFVNSNKIPADNYKLYSIIIGSGSHFWNYSRDTDSDQWWKYNYSNVDRINKEEVQDILSTGFDNKNAPILIFYEMENYEQYELQVKLADLNDFLTNLKNKLSEFNAKFGALQSKLVGG